MSELSLSQNVIYLRGEVSVKTVTRLSKQLHRLIQPRIHTVDCSGVTRGDSSIAALLLVAFKLDREAGASVTVSVLPEAVSRLIKLYDLEGIILNQSCTDTGNN